MQWHSAHSRTQACGRHLNLQLKAALFSESLTEWVRGYGYGVACCGFSSGNNFTFDFTEKWNSSIEFFSFRASACLVVAHSSLWVVWGRGTMVQVVASKKNPPLGKLMSALAFSKLEQTKKNNKRKRHLSWVPSLQLRIGVGFMSAWWFSVDWRRLQSEDHMCSVIERVTFSGMWLFWQTVWNGDKCSTYRHVKNSRWLSVNYGDRGNRNIAHTYIQGKFSRMLCTSWFLSCRY